MCVGRGKAQTKSVFELLTQDRIRSYAGCTRRIGLRVAFGLDTGLEPEGISCEALR